MKNSGSYTRAITVVFIPSTIVAFVRFLWL